MFIFRNLFQYCLIKQRLVLRKLLMFSIFYVGYWFYNLVELQFTWYVLFQYNITTGGYDTSRISLLHTKSLKTTLRGHNCLEVHTGPILLLHWLQNTSAWYETLASFPPPADQSVTNSTLVSLLPVFNKCEIPDRLPLLISYIF